MIYKCPRLPSAILCRKTRYQLNTLDRLLWLDHGVNTLQQTLFATAPNRGPLRFCMPAHCREAQFVFVFMKNVQRCAEYIKTVWMNPKNLLALLFSFMFIYFFGQCGVLFCYLVDSICIYDSMIQHDLISWGQRLFAPLAWLYQGFQKTTYQDLPSRLDFPEASLGIFMIPSILRDPSTPPALSLP